MAIRLRSTLKEYFKRGKYPLEEQFADWIDSFIHKSEDKIQITNVEDLSRQLNSKYDSASGETLEKKQQLLRDDFNRHVLESSAKFKKMASDIKEIKAEESKGEIAGRYWDETSATPTAAGYYGSLPALKKLPERLGLGRYLVTDDRKKRKLDPTDSTRFEDGTPASLDGTMGQCMWCWNEHYFTTWEEDNKTILVVTFQPIEGKNSIYVPAGGISWFDAAVVDRVEQKLCSVISTDERYRGGTGNALPDNFNIPPADAPQRTMLGMPASGLPLIMASPYARKRGEGWEANWFVARAVVEYLFEIIMGTRNAREDYHPEPGAYGLRQGGFGLGTNLYFNWTSYNDGLPIIPTNVGVEMGDGVGLVEYSLKKADGQDYTSFRIPVFFGLVHSGYGHIARMVNGLITKPVSASTREVFIAQSMYAGFDHNSTENMLKVGECKCDFNRGFIKRKSYKGLCCMPTEIDGAGSLRTHFASSYSGWGGRVIYPRVAGGFASTNGTEVGLSCTSLYDRETSIHIHVTTPLCYFERDPIINVV